MTLVSRLLLAAALVCAAPAFAQGPEKPSPDVQKEFDGFIGKFRAALKANDSAAVAGMTRFPFDDTTRTAADFRKTAYPRDFTANVRACIRRRKAVYARDGQNNDQFSIFCGEEIFVFTRTPAGFLFTDLGVND